MHATADVWDVLRNEFKISHEVTRPEVQEQIRWLVAHPSYIQKVCRQSEPYIYHIVGEIKKRKLPGELALLPMIESAYDPFAYSGAGAAGLWQLMPRTGSDLGLKQDWWFDGRRSIGPSTDAALNYLVYLNKYFNGSWILAIAAYDSGEGNLGRKIKSSVRPRQAVNFWNLPTSRETKLYVPRLLALAELIKNPGRYKVELTSIPYLPYFEEVNIGSQIDLNHAAKLAGISYKEIKKLNPGFNRYTTAPYKPFRLLLPTEKVARFNHNLANAPEAKKIKYTKHLVKKGDSLNNIATRYHTTVALIKQFNHLKTAHLKLNQSILIPGNTAPVVAKANASVVPKIVFKREEQSKKQHIVKRGDSLSVIAKMHKTKINKLIQLNPGLTRKKILKLGQKIMVG